MSALVINTDDGVGAWRPGGGPPGTVRRLVSREEVVEILSTPAARALMLARQVGQVYRLLGRHGISQRRIAALTGQSQSEISEILSGRQVGSVEVLERICDGLGVPRGWFGVAFTDDEPEGEPTELELEFRRIEALPFPEGVRVALLRAVVTGLHLGASVAAAAEPTTG